MANRSSRQPHRGRSSLRRKVADRDPKRTFLVYCEGRITEPEYLEALKQQPAVREIASVDIRIDRDESGVVPLTLVTAAAEARARASDENSEVDEVWCLFDVESPVNHPNLDRAVSLAEESNVQVAISNPCFELWLALHFKPHTDPLDTNDAENLRSDHDGSTNKSVSGATYMPLRAVAARRARYLSGKHEREGNVFPRDNPSSGMFLFLDAIERGPEGRL